MDANDFMLINASTLLFRSQVGNPAIGQAPPFPSFVEHQLRVHNEGYAELLTWCWGDGLRSVSEEVEEAQQATAASTAATSSTTTAAPASATAASGGAGGGSGAVGDAGTSAGAADSGGILRSGAVAGAAARSRRARQASTTSSSRGHVGFDQVEINEFDTELEEDPKTHHTKIHLGSHLVGVSRCCNTNATPASHPSNPHSSLHICFTSSARHAMWHPMKRSVSRSAYVARTTSRSPLRTKKSAAWSAMAESCSRTACRTASRSSEQLHGQPQRGAAGAAAEEQLEEEPQVQVRHQGVA